MNIAEGANRMQRAGRAMLIIALCIFALSIVGAGVDALLPSYLHIENYILMLPVLIIVVWACVMAAALGTVLWVADWILDGFHNSR